MLYVYGGCSTFLRLETAILSQIHALFIAQVRKSQLLSTSEVREVRFLSFCCEVATFHHRGST